MKEPYGQFEVIFGVILKQQGFDLRFEFPVVLLREGNLTQNVGLSCQLGREEEFHIAHADAEAAGRARAEPARCAQLGWIGGAGPVGYRRESPEPNSVNVAVEPTLPRL